MIRISDLTFGYTPSRKLFHHLNIDIPSGQIHGLLGLNGAGKSSLLHLIQGLKYPHSGTIKVNEFTPSQRRVSFLQDAYLLPEEIYTPAIRIPQFVKMYSSFYPHFSLEAFLKFLNEFEIDRASNLGQMSMGQKKKAIIAFALATNTQLLMMDEPTNGLDIPSKKQFRKILSYLVTENRLFIVSTHQIRDLHSLIDNVIIIKEGRIVFNHTIVEICDHLHFSLTPQEIDNKQVIYNERVPGGYLNISRANGQPSFEPDIEVLFNAIITESKVINEVFQN